jgi:hypothetical protein
MSQLVKTKCQANFKDFKRFGAFKGLFEQKNFVFYSFLCKLELCVNAKTHAKKGPIYTQTRYINYYFCRDKCIDRFATSRAAAARRSSRNEALQRKNCSRFWPPVLRQSGNYNGGTSNPCGQSSNNGLVLSGWPY